MFGTFEQVGIMKINSKKIEEFFAPLINIKGVGNIVYSLAFLVILFVPLFEDIYTSSPISTQVFIGKEKMISMVNNFKYHVLKDKIFTGLIANQDGWLAYTGEKSLDDFQNADQFTSGELENIRARLNNLCSKLTESGIKLIIVVPPNKNTIYPEYMPFEITQMNKESRLDQVMTIWSDTDNCKMVDLRNILFEAKKNNKVYYSTDTHWNQFGAFLAYQELAKIMKIDFPAIKVRSLSDFQLGLSIFSGDLRGGNFGHFDLSEETVNLQFKFKPNYSSRYFTSPEGVNMIITHSSENTLPKAIFYRDSFFTAVYPYISEDFSEAYYFWSQNIDFEWVNLKKPDYLILEVAERYLGDVFFNIPNLK